MSLFSFAPFEATPKRFSLQVEPYFNFYFAFAKGIATKYKLFPNRLPIRISHLAS